MHTHHQRVLDVKTFGYQKFLASQLEDSLRKKTSNANKDSTVGSTNFSKNLSTVKEIITSNSFKSEM